MKDGSLVVHGDVGHTFMYAAKGGDVFVLGNAAGRPLVNAVGWPRVVINGTCLDYLAESFMAGDPLNGGGFAVLNGVTFDEDGHPVDLDAPYPGGNLFSLASGGAVYVRDPHGTLTDDQLNGGSSRTSGLRSGPSSARIWRPTSGSSGSRWSGCWPCVDELSGRSASTARSGRPSTAHCHRRRPGSYGRREDQKRRRARLDGSNRLSRSRGAGRSRPPRPRSRPGSPRASAAARLGSRFA